MGKAISGDFIGFTFNGIHSSTLGILRVSVGDRYTEDLLPTAQDKVVDAPGADETYYFGSYYKQKVIQVSFAFEDLNETQIRQLKQLFSDKGIHELWFDETPYKAYNVKVNGVPSLKYICFNKLSRFSEPIRIYKGEGTISFIAYYPFAYSRFKYFDRYSNYYGNKNEWIPSSGIIPRGNYDKVLIVNEEENTRKIELWNGGDLESDFKLNISFEDSDSISGGTIKVGDNILKLKEMPKQGKDTGVQIDSKIKLIRGYQIINKEKVYSSNVYNKYISSGDFFKIPLNKSTMEISGLYGGEKGEIDIDYKYWYL